MTYPVTPDPSIHAEPPQVAADQKAQTVAQLRAMFATLPEMIVKNVVNAILQGLGLGSLVGPVDAGLDQITAELQQWDTKLATIGDDARTLTNDILAALGLSKTGNASDVGNAFDTLMGDLFGSGAVVGTNTTNIQHSALPSAYANVGTDLQTLFNDVVFADGRTWADIGPDIQTLVNDLVGDGHTVTVTAPSQIPHTAIASVSGGADLGADVTAVTSTANTAGTGVDNLSSNLYGSATPPAAPVGSAAPTPIHPAAIPTGVPAANITLTGITSSTGTSNLQDILTDIQNFFSDIAAGALDLAKGDWADAVTMLTDASKNAQGVIDGIFQASNGGTATNNAVSTVKPALTQIPASNIVGAATAAVTYDSTGNGATYVSSSTTPASISATWQHTATNASAMIIVAAIEYDGGGGSLNASCTVDGIAATSIDYIWTSQNPYDENATLLEAWWIKTPLTGAHTVVINAATTSGAYTGSICANSVAYANAATYTMGNTSSDSMSTEPQVSGTNTTNSVIVGAFASAIAIGAANSGQAPAFTGFNATQRANLASNYDKYYATALVLGDGNSVGSQTISATGPASSYGGYWAGMSFVVSS